VLLYKGMWSTSLLEGICLFIFILFTTGHQQSHIFYINHFRLTRNVSKGSDLNETGLTAFKYKVSRIIQKIWHTKADTCDRSCNSHKHMAEHKIIYLLLQEAEEHHFLSSDYIMINSLCKEQFISKFPNANRCYLRNKSCIITRKWKVAVKNNIWIQPYYLFY
jgi:hypothetical protein